MSNLFNFNSLLNQHWRRLWKKVSLYLEINDNNRQFKIISFLSIPLSLMLAAYSYITFIKLNHIPFAVLEGVSCLFAVLSNYVFYKTNNFRFAAGMLNASGIGAIMGAIIFTGGTSSPALFWGPLIVVGSGMVNGQKSLLFWTFLYLGFLLLLGKFDGQIQSSQYLISDPALLDHIRARALYGSLIFCAIISYIYIGIIDNKIRRIESSEDQLHTLLKIISHDLSNPLSVIGMTAHRIHDRVDQTVDLDKLVRQRGKLISSVDHISDILTKVREMEAIHSGKLEFTLSPIDVVACTRKAINLFELRMDEKDIRVLVMGDTEKPIFILGDSTLLVSQIIGNILSNAIKFSNEGSKILIDIQNLKDEVIVSVQDFGIGVPDSLKQQIFDVSRPTTRKGTSGEKGTGFGMPLVKTFVEKMDGRISIHSNSEPELGSTGTTMVLTFPKDKSIDSISSKSKSKKSRTAA